MNNEIVKVKPFLKWAGGKRWFVANHDHLLFEGYDRYIEPFLGAGAVFFHENPKSALLSDINLELIEAYQSIRNRWRQVITLLEEHQVNHCKEYYYHMRSATLSTKIERAARFIYLNRTCWNGLYRVNLKGEFNVPIGTKNTVLFPDENFSAISKVLKNAKITNNDFESSIDNAGLGDFLFIDPPYTVKHNNNGFVKYNEKIFTWYDQERLFYALQRAKKRGASIVVTNANHESISSLYKTGFEKIEVRRASTISGKAIHRAKYDELVMISR